MLLYSNIHPIPFPSKSGLDYLFYQDPLILLKGNWANRVHHIFVAFPCLVGYFEAMFSRFGI